MALWGSITFFQKRYSVIGLYNVFFKSVTKLQEVSTLWRYGGRQRFFQKHYTLSVPLKRTNRRYGLLVIFCSALCLYGVMVHFSYENVMTLWVLSKKRYGVIRYPPLSLPLSEVN